MIKCIQNLFKKDMKENISIEENTSIFINDFEEIVKQGDIEEINKLIKFMANSVQAELMTKCTYNDRNYISYFEYIKNSFLVDVDCKENSKYNTVIQIASTPIISCIWNNDRVICALKNINEKVKNSFDGITHANNIRAYRIESLGLVVVRNGNHSANSAIIHGEGELIVDTIIDITPALEKYRYNGKDFVDIKTQKKINSKYMKNGSEPFTYTMGLMFEMTRIMKKYGY